MTGKVLTHYPKGEMCLGCTKLMDNCSGLPFNTMYILEKGEENVVRCTSYERNTKPRKTKERKCIAKRRKKV
jgi:hypothetical protein